MLFAVGNDFVNGGEVETCALLPFCDPTPLTSQVTVVGDRYKLKSREYFSALLSFLKFIEPGNPFPSKIIDELPFTAAICLQKII
jgi:hypothetical protein